MVATTTQKDGRDAELEASKRAAMEALDKLFEAKDHFRHAAESAGLDMKHEAVDRLMKGRHKAEEAGAQANEFIHEKPLATLGIAVVGGFLLAQMLTRR